MYDYIVVGAGVAGCRIARHLEEHGKDYIVLEASPEVSLKDSGMVSSRIFQLYDNPPVKKSWEHITIHGQYAESTVQIPGGVHVLQRQKFGKMLRRGLNISYERVNGITIGENSASIKTVDSEYEAKYVIAADGAMSPVRRILGIKPPLMLPGVFSFSKPGNGIEVWFDKSISEWFFAWRIGEEYGLADESVDGKLTAFMKRFGLEPERIYGGFIPISWRWPAHGRVVLLGDAAGMTKPVTGGGIIYSTMAADMLFRTIRLGKSFSYFARLWLQKFGIEYEAGYIFRKLYPLMPQPIVDRLVSVLGITDRFDYDFLVSFALRLYRKVFKAFVKS